MAAEFIDYNSLDDTVKIPNNQYFGNYRGTVLNNDDSIQHRGRCKIFVRGIYPEKFEANKGEMLPWAEPCQPLFCGGKDIDGTFQCPDIGSTVWLFFESGDISRPVFFGQTTDAQGKFDIEHDTMRWRKMYIDYHHDMTKDEHILSIYAEEDINNTANMRDITTFAGRDINTKATNNINEEAGVDKNLKAGQNIVIEAGQEITIKAGSKITIQAPIINITGSSAVNLSGNGGDCVIAGTSLENHTHPYIDTYPGMGRVMTSPPEP